MPYPDANTYAITTPSTSLDPRSNGLTGFVGNAHTGRATANGLTGFAMPPFRGWSSVWTGVDFDGTNDYLTNLTNLGLASNGTFTMAAAFNWDGGLGNIIGMNAGGLPLLQVTATGALVIASPTAAPPGTNGFASWESPAGTIVAGVDYVVHVAATAATNVVQVWVNGKLIAPSTGPVWYSTSNFTMPGQWAIGHGAGGSDKFNGRVGLVWFDVGQYIVDPSKFYPAYDLGAQLANPGARPAIGFGGVQTATDWNAGTNLGDGTGTWTRSGDFTA
jgi:hypothetical protein